MPVIEVSGLRSSYGSTPILQGVNFSVEQGEIVGLIGRNGVGKTTTMRCLMGLLPADAGSITFLDNDITNTPADERARLGIGYIPQGRHVFPRMTVQENLSVGELIGRSRGRRRRTGLVYDYFPVLREKRKQLAGSLSGGQQQQLAIARTLIGSPALILLDEPSEGIQPSIVQLICRVLKSVRSELGATVVLVEQNMDTILALAERCYVIEKGRTVSEIPRGQVSQESVRRWLLL